MRDYVSIIVPLYKAEEYIVRCAQSLFEQTFGNIEYIFVNDASPDNSIDLLNDTINHYPQRKAHVKILSHQRNLGVSAARNTGLKAATGDYVIYCDSDDWVDIQMVEILYSAAIRENADIVSCDFSMIYPDKKVPYKTVDWSDNHIESLKKYIVYTWTVLVNLLVKRDLYIKNNLSSIEGAIYCEDFNLSTKLLLHAQKVYHVNKVLYFYNQLNSSSITHNLNPKAMHDEQMMCFDVINYFKQKNVYNFFQKELSWRILKSKQEWVLNEDSYQKFNNFYPESHKYILSCPYIGIKLKLMMWTLTHHCGFIARFMLLLRHLKHNT